MQPTVMQVPSHASVASSGSTWIEEAINYLQKVKEKFREQLDTYRDLLVILKDYKYQSYNFKRPQTHMLISF